MADQQVRGNMQRGKSFIEQHNSTHDAWFGQPWALTH
jgi:hypothetical protein